MTGKHREKLAILAVELKDPNRRPVSARSKIVVTHNGKAKKQYRATGKPDAVTRFTFELPPGAYTVAVECAGFQHNRHLVSLRAGKRRVDEVMLDWEPVAERVKPSEGEGQLVDARLREFGAARSHGLEGFPVDGRASALDQKRRMLDPEVTNSPLVVKPVPDPAPHASLCNIGAWVDVRARNPKLPFARALLKIPYREDQLGWVDPSTVRVFAVSAKERRFQLIVDSGDDAERRWAWAYIDRPGIYGLIGLPRDPGVLETVRAFFNLRPDNNRGAGSLRERICNLILCADTGNTLRPPGGFAGSACDLCNRLEPPPEGLPEGRLLGGPPAGPRPGPPPSGSCAWVSTGPRNINGRITALAVHPGVANRVFAGTANAGVWRSDDAGVSWTPLMSKEGALEIGALVVHLTDPAQPTGDVTIYAGTGETRAFNGYRGVGVLKSTTSGAPGSWNPTGSIPTPGGNTFTSIAVDFSSVTAAGTSTVVYAGCPGGLYKTINAGGAWTQILNKNIQSVVLDPIKPQIIYVGVAYEGIYKYDPTTSTWAAFNTDIATPFPQLIAVDMGRSAPHTLYTKLDQAVYKYNTAMNTWESLGNHGGATYGYWNNFLAVDPTDSKIVFVGGIGVERTYDGGLTWQSPWVGHEDNHACAYDSANHFQVYNGNDGGVFLGTYASASDTGTWVKRSNGLTISHLNFLGASPSAPDLLGCGVQDNGTIRTSGGLTWDSLPVGGDGSAFIIDPTDPRILYAQLTTFLGGAYYNSHPYKSTDGGVTFTAADSGYVDSGSGPFLGTLVLDPNSPPEPNRVLIIAAAGNVVQRTTNSASTWATSSPALGAEVSALAVAPSSSAVVLAGTQGGAVWRSSDGGATVGKWKNVTVGSAGSATLPPRKVSKIVVHPTDPNTVFVSFSGFNGASPGHVFRGTSSDGWATNWTWTDITSNLPDIPVNALEIKRPVSMPVTLWAGTDTGVFQTTDGGLSWTPFDNGLPNVVIADLALNADGDVLRAAAYGYSMWEIRLASSCPQMDIYVRDDKLETGEGAALSGVPDPTQGSGFVYWWQSVDIKTDIYPYQPAPVDGIDFDHFIHQDPIVNDSAHPNANKLYIQVHNRGPLPSLNVKVKPLWADASTALPPLPDDFWGAYPNAWTKPSAWSPVDALLPYQSIPQLLPHTPKVLTWNWTIPTTAHQHSCMFVVISADDDNVTRSDGVPNDHFLWVVSPNDKHAALRNLHVVGGVAPPPPGGGGGGAPRPVGAVIDLHNPFVNGDFFDVLFDPESLPKGTRVSLLLPEFRSRTPIGRGRGQVPIAAVGSKAWWHKSAIPKRAWKHEFKLSEAVVHDAMCGRPLATVAGLFIAGRDKLRAAVVIAPPKGAQPGGIYRCSLLQRQAGAIIGGSTVEVRIPMLELLIKRPG